MENAVYDETAGLEQQIAKTGFTGTLSQWAQTSAGREAVQAAVKRLEQRGLNEVREMPKRGIHL
jgi:hypothetical protein